MRKKHLFIIGISFVIIMMIIFILRFYINNQSKLQIELITEKEKNQRYFLEINYPKTNLQKLDLVIKQYVQGQKEYFLQYYGDSDYLSERDELKITCEYHIHSPSYISISLITYIHSYKLQYPIYEINTFFYSVLEDRNLVLKELLTNDSQEIFLSILKKTIQTEYPHAVLERNIDSVISEQLLLMNSFFLNDESLVFYLSPDILSSDYYDLITIEIPLDVFKFSVLFES